MMMNAPFALGPHGGGFWLTHDLGATGTALFVIALLVGIAAAIYFRQK
jgi:hypothetical protein